ncbi:UDP-glucose dehydrogenase family protein [Thermoproteota archaeon]
MKISVIGAGYVGLVTGTCLADLGYSIHCVEKNNEKLDSLKHGACPFFEPGLDDYMQNNITASRLTFSNDIKKAVTESGIIFIAVGTPQKSNGEPDVSHVMDVIKNICDHLQDINLEKSPKILIMKSTVPVGTCRKISEYLQKNNISQTSCQIVSNPEFLREGTAVEDFFRPDRIVIGCDDKKTGETVGNLYRGLYRIETPIVMCSLETAELSKYASNAFLATKISFINEIANLCSLIGADVHKIAKIMGMDGRIGKYFLHPGPGYGGACLPKDTKAMLHFSSESGYDLRIIKAVDEVNSYQKNLTVQRLLSIFNNTLSDKHFAILGIAFKPNTDDIREAPALTIINQLLEQKASITVCDPEALENTKSVFGNKLSYTKSAYECAKNADALIIVTEWNAFRELDLLRIKSLMNHALIVDTRNVYDPDIVKNAGFQYEGFGRDHF